MAGDEKLNRDNKVVSINNRLLTPLPAGQIPSQHRSPKVTGSLTPDGKRRHEGETSRDVENIQKMREQLRQLSGSDQIRDVPDRISPAQGVAPRLPSRPSTSIGLSPQAKQYSRPEAGRSRPRSSSPTKGLSKRTAPGLERDEDRIPGWSKLWDQGERAWYWIDTNNHSTQWNHPYSKFEPKVLPWDGKAKPVQARAERSGVSMGLTGADWFPQHATVRLEDTENSTVQTRRAIVMMLQKWSEKWDTLSHAFRQMDVNHDGNLSRSELATALIRFNIMHSDTLVEQVWSMIDVDGSGSVSMDEFKRFLSLHGSKQVSVDHSYVSSKDQLRGNAENVLRPKHTLDPSALHRIKQEQDAAGRRHFTRRVIDMLGRLLASFEGGRGRIGKADFVQMLVQNQLMPKNEVYVSQMFEFLDKTGTAKLRAEDLSVANLRSFAATPMPPPATEPPKPVMWNPVDGGSTPEQIELLPSPHRKYILHFRDLLATRCQGSKDTFRYLDWDKDGVIHKHEFLKALADLGMEMPPATFEYLWQVLDTDQDGKIKFGEYIDLFENIRSQPKRLPPTAAVRPANNPVTGLRIPNYLATRASMSGRVLNVVMVAPSNKEKPMRVPMMTAKKDLHKRQEYLGIHPKCREWREAVLTMGSRPDLGAKDIFKRV